MSFHIRKSFLMLALLLLASPIFAAPAVQTPAKPAPVQTVKQIQVTPLALVNNPKNYINKTIIMDGKFDKFTTLGLDYKRAFRDSQKYIGFLIQRDDTKDHNIPLSELKLFLKREYAEKFIDLNTGDKISILGTVFSDALGDGWVDVTSIEVLEKAKSDSETK